MQEELISLSIDEQWELGLPDIVSEYQVISRIDSIISNGESYDYDLTLGVSIFLRFKELKEINSIVNFIVFCFHVYYINDEMYKLFQKIHSYNFLKYSDDNLQTIFILMHQYSYLNSLEDFLNELKKFSNPDISYNDKHKILFSHNYECNIFSDYLSYQKSLNSNFISIDFLINTKSIYIINSTFLFHILEKDLYLFLINNIKDNKLETMSEFMNHLYLFISKNDYSCLYNILFDCFYGTIYFDMFDHGIEDYYYVLKEKFILNKQICNF